MEGITTPQLVGFFITILLHSVGLAFFLGKLFASVTELRRRDNERSEGIEELHNKIDSFSSDLFDTFVTKGQCKGINDQWKIEVKGLLAQRDIYNAQNSKEHGSLTKLLERTNKQLEKISDCLHRLQNKKDCD